MTEPKPESLPLADLDPDAQAMLQAFQTVGQRSPAAIDAALKSTVGAATAAAPAAGGGSVVLKLLSVAVVSGALGVAAWAVTGGAAEPDPGSAAGAQASPNAFATAEAAPSRSERTPATTAPVPGQSAAEADPATVDPSPPVESNPIRSSLAPKAVARPSPRTPVSPPATPRRGEPPDEPFAGTPDSPPAGTSADLVAELRLLRKARTALKGQDPRAALKAAATHRGEYPEGELAEERDATEITALCQLGMRAKARTKAAAFHRAFPASERDVLGACASDSTEVESP